MQRSLVQLALDYSILKTDTGKIWKDTAVGKWTQMGGQDLPIATKTTLGGIKVGANLAVAADGTLSAMGSDNMNTFIIKQEMFVATEGQTLFNLTKGSYQPNMNAIQYICMVVNNPI